MDSMRQSMYRYGATDMECWWCHYIVPVYPKSTYGNSSSNSCVNCGRGIQYHPETGETTEPHTDWDAPENAGNIMTLTLTEKKCQRVASTWWKFWK